MAYDDKVIHASSEQRVAVVGLGKIGLPLAIQCVRSGKQVIGCDINPEVVKMINAGIAHIHEESELVDEVTQAVKRHRLQATEDTTGAVRQANVVIVVVPVSVTDDKQHQIDFTFIDSATRAIGAGLKPGTLVVYETTLPVGTTSGRLRTLLEETSQLVAGHDFHLAFSPERVSSGSIFKDLRTYPKVVGGITSASTEAAVAFYSSLLDAEIIAMANSDEAEFVKLIETTYRDVNIALANEFARFADAHGLDSARAISAANTQPYAHIHTPGVGVGGHCIPVYPYFLLRDAEEGMVLPRHARVINDGMSLYAVQRLEAAIGSLKQQCVVILGVAYRGNVREVAFSSARLLHEELVQRGAVVLVDDPLFTTQELQAMGYTPLTEEYRARVTAVIVQAGHSEYQHYTIRSRFPTCRVVLDGRRVLRGEVIKDQHISYIYIGDGAGGRSISDVQEQ